MKINHRGRKVDSFATPHRNRNKYLIKYWFMVRDYSRPAFSAQSLPWVWGHLGELVAYRDIKQVNEHITAWLKANIGIAHKIKRVTVDFKGSDYVQ